MKSTRSNRILSTVLLLSLAIVIVLSIGIAFGKYTFSGNVGGFTLNIVPRSDPAEVIMNMVPEGGTLTRIVYDRWDDGYSDAYITIDASEWQETNYEVYDPKQPHVRMFARQHDGTNYTVYVLSAEDIYAPTNGSQMFSGTEYGRALQNSVTEISLLNFHFKSGTTASGLFNGCAKLTTLDLTGMDFTPIAEQVGFFGSSSPGHKITNLNISKTKWPSKMREFFCATSVSKPRLPDITTINMKGIDTSNVTKINQMFRGMSKLTSIEGLQDLDISKVDNIQELFYNCQKLSSSCFVDFAEALRTANKLYNFKWMFYQCYGLDKTAFDAVIAALAARSSDAAKITSLQGTFHNCTGISGDIDVSALDLTSATNISEMFHSCKNLNSVKLPATTNKLTTIYRLFYDCNNLTSVDLSQINTSNVVNMNGLFYECSELMEIDLSSFDTSSVTTLSKDPTKSQYFGMFEKCGKLRTVYVGENWDVSHIDSTQSQNMFLGCVLLVGGNGTRYDPNITDKTYARIDTPETPGYFWSTYTLPEASGLKTNIASANENSGKTLTKIVFDYWDPVNGYDKADITADKWSEGIDLNKFGTIKIFLQASGSESTMFILSEKDIIAPINSSYLFSGTGKPGNTSQSYGTMKKVKQIVFNNFYLPNGVTADHMFYNCSALSSITLTSWAQNSLDELNLDTAFYGCTALTSLDLSSLAKDTLKSISLNNAFQNCSALTSLDFSSFSVCPLEKLSLQSALSGCKSLSSLDLSHLAQNTLNELNLKSAFSGCSSLTSMDLSSFAVANDSLTKLDIRGTFNGCTSLESLDMSGIDFTIHSNIFDNSSFSNLSSLKTLDFSNTTWWYGNITYIWTMKTVESVDFTGINTERVNNMSDVFNSWSNLREIIGIEDLDTTGLEDLGETFKGCSSLEDEYFAGFAQALANGNSVTNLSYAFSGCTKMSNNSFNAIISALNTGNTKKVTTVTGAFSNCTGLSGVLDMSDFDITGVTDDRNTMFTGCTNITTIIWSDTEVEQSVDQSVGVNIDVSGTTNALVTANGDFISEMLYTENGVLRLDIEADEGYVLPETFTVDIDGEEYLINTVNNGESSDIYFDGDIGCLFISDELLSQGSLVVIRLECVEEVPEEDENEAVEDDKKTTLTFEVKNLTFDFSDGEIVTDEDVVITFTAGEGYEQPETIIITIDDEEYIIYTSEENSNKNPEGITFDIETGTLTISKDLLKDAEAITIAAEGIEKEDEESKEENPDADKKDESEDKDNTDKENEAEGGETTDKETEGGTDTPNTEDKTETEGGTDAPGGENTEVTTPETNPDDTTESEDNDDNNGEYNGENEGETESPEPDTEVTTPTTPDTEDNTNTEQGDENVETEENGEGSTENGTEETTPDTESGSDDETTTPTEPTTPAEPSEPAVSPETPSTSEPTTGGNDDDNGEIGSADSSSTESSSNSGNDSSESDTLSESTTSTTPSVTPIAPTTSSPAASETSPPSASTQASGNSSSAPASSTPALSTNSNSNGASQASGTTTPSGSKETSSEE